LIPPVFFLSYLAFATAMTFWLPWPFSLSDVVTAYVSGPPGTTAPVESAAAGSINSFLKGLGYVLCFILPVVIFTVAWAFRQKSTPIDPRKVASVLKTDGLFRFSRNPIYFSEMIFAVGMTLVTSSPWYLVLSPYLVFSLRWFVIEVEEPRLQAALGEEYFAYCQRVPRWIGIPRG